MALLFDDRDTTIVNIERWQERRRQIQIVAEQVTPEQAVNMARLARMFPMVSPGVIRGLGQSGLSPDDPATQFAITQEFLRNFSQTGNWSGQLGQVQRQGQNSQQGSSAGISTNGKQSALMRRARSLLKTGETLGVFDPKTQVLVEPEFSEGEDEEAESRAHKVFTSLQDIIYEISNQPVPYVAKDGKIRGFTPLSGTAGDREYELEPRTNPGDIGGIETIIGAERDPSGIGGSIGQREDYGLTAQAEAASTVIQQIYADAEAESTQATLDKAQAANRAPQMAGLPGGPPSRAIRGVMTAFDAPVQEIQGLVRNVYGEMHGEDVDWLESQSDLGIILPRLIRGQHVDVGTGYFVDPDSAVASERRQREAERGQIGNHNITIGRILANGVGFEPDTKPFQIISGLADLSVQLADPTAYVLGKTNKAQKAARLFAPDDTVQAAGGLKGIRHYFSPPTAEQFLNKETKLVDWLTTTRDPYEIAKRTNFKLEPALVNNLANASKPQDIRGIINGAVQRGRIRSPQELTGTKTQRAVRSWEEVNRVLNPNYMPRTRRILAMMPGQTLDLDDPVQVASNLRRVLQNAHADDTAIGEVYNMVARAKTRNGLRDAVFEAQSKVNGLLDQYGLKDAEIRSFLTRINKSTYQEDLRGLIDEIGTDVPTWDTMTINGVPTKVAGPHLPLEHISRYIHLPDQRAIRRLTSRYKFLTTAESDLPVLTPLKIKMGKEIVRDPVRMGAPRLPIAAADFLMGEFLKPAWLLRLAWPLRVIGEEQIRMAADGLHSTWNHPISYLATVIGSDETRLARFLDKMSPGLKGKLDISPSGALFDEAEELAKVTYRVHSQWMDQPGTIPTSLPTVYTKNNINELADYRSAWARELALLHNDPVSNFVANSTFDEAVDWLYRGPGNKYRRELMEAHPGNLETEAQVQAYIQTITDRISRSTAAHPDLIDIVKSGKFSTFKGDEEIIGNIFIDKPRVNPMFTRHLEGYTDVGPDKMRGYVTSQTKMQAEFMPRWDHAIDRLMSTLMGVPTSTLSRSPAFRQYVWRRTAELLPYADDASRARILANAQTAGLSKRELRNLEQAAKRGKRGTDGKFIGKLDADEVDLLAKGYAVDDTKTLLYDLSERSQIADIMRILVPFGEAWKEVLTRWAKLATISGPGGIPLPGKPVRRFQQIMQGARGSDLGNFIGAGVDPITGQDRGFFYTNEFGDEVYAYPGSQWLTSALTGVPVPLTGRVQGLNMFGTIIPGLGPVAQIPIAWFLQDKPELEWWRQQLLPFGAPGSENSDDILFASSYFPAWAKTAWTAFTEGGGDNRLYNSSVMYAASYLYSTGEYGDTPEEQQRLLEDAKKRSRNLYAIRALGQFVLPSSPAFDWMVRDTDGNLLGTRILYEEYIADVEELGPDEATAKFLDTYGFNAVGAITPHSRNIISGVPVSLEGAEWVSKHPSIKKKYDLVYGFFAPEGDFHYPTYIKNYQSGEREALTPKQWIQVRDTMLGNFQYNRMKQMLGDDADSPNKEQQEWLREQRKMIQEAYPQWRNEIGLAGKSTSDPDRVIGQLYDAVKDRTIRNTDAGKGLIFYLNARDQALKIAEEAGFVSFKTADELAPIRAWLTEEAYRAIKAYPDFRRLWDVVLSREMEDAPVEGSR